ncbi:MAG: GNAT family N-acetyltransferase [Deltaproteobacteria bacterium]|nr:GNAT family N-acetyltransferase [Deltaproteobacteria bacterium]
MKPGPVSTGGLVFRAFELARELPEARAMAEEAWRRDYRRKAYLDLFDERFCALNFEVPGAFGYRPLAWGVYEGDRIVGFAAGVPRRIRVRGRELDTYVVGWLTVHARHRRRGIATMLYERAYEELHSSHDGAFMFLDKGHASTLVFDRLEQDRPTHVIVGKVSIALRVLDAAGFFRATPLHWYERAYLGLRHRRPEFAEDPAARPYRPGDLDACLDLSRRIAADVCRLWDREELGHHLAHSETIVHESGGRVRGFVNCVVIRQLGLEARDIALLETVATGDLDTGAATRLVGAALAGVRDKGCIAALEFDWRYFDRAILRGCGFFLAPRDVYLSFLVGRERLEGFRARTVYLDWR